MDNASLYTDKQKKGTAGAFHYGVIYLQGVRKIDSVMLNTARLLLRNLYSPIMLYSAGHYYSRSELKAKSRGACWAYREVNSHVIYDLRMCTFIIATSLLRSGLKPSHPKIHAFHSAITVRCVKG